MIEYKGKRVLGMFDPVAPTTSTFYISLDSQIKGDLNVSVEDYKTPTVAQLRKILSAIESTKASTVRIGCFGGAGRTGTILAVVNALSKNIPADKAVEAVREIDSGYVETLEQEAFVETVVATADYGILDYPTLVASAYALWFMRDTNQKAAYEYEKIMPILKQLTLKYGRIAMAKEIDNVMDVVSTKLGDPELLRKETDILNKGRCFDIITSMARKWDDIYTKRGGDAVLKWLVDNIDLKSAANFFKCIHPKAMYGGEGWRKISEYLLQLADTSDNKPGRIMLVFDKLVHVQHRTGNLFKKFDFAKKLNKVIELKAKPTGLKELINLLPRKLGWLKAKYQNKEV